MPMPARKPVRTARMGSMREEIEMLTAGLLCGRDRKSNSPTATFANVFQAESLSSNELLEAL